MEDKKYILTSETRKVDGHILHRIRAVRDIDIISPGDVGGWVENEDNLSHIGDSWIFSDACVYGNAKVFENAKVYGNARVFNEALVYGNAQIYGEAVVCGCSRIFGYARVMEDATVEGNAWIRDCAMVYGFVRIDGDITVNGNAQLFDNTIFKQRQFIVVGPIGSRGAYTTFSVNVDRSEILVATGCFRGTIEEFDVQVIKRHQYNPLYLEEYQKASGFAKVYFS